MADNDTSRVWMKILQHSDLALAIAVVTVLVVLIIPVPPFLLDILLTVNISFGLITLLVTLSTNRALQFSTFPSLLLFATLFRLALNVASTRLILLDGFAGKVITAFGDFVVGGNIVVGMIVFLILVVIQFVVITKGSSRISEVAARFTLDAMPGKQMAIDADLNAGLITEDQARERRETISQEAEFYGAMDGASKFVRGDAIAGIIITVINIFGGVIIGMMNSMAPGEALHKYAILTVGDGLVSQIPSLIIATASGVIITKASTRTQLSTEMVSQLFRQSRPLAVATGILAFFALVPGLPKLPFIVIAMVLGSLYLMSRKDAQKIKAAAAAGGAEPLPGAKRAATAPAAGATTTTPAAAPGDSTAHGGHTGESIQDLTKTDRLSVEVGYQLVPLVDPKSTSGLLDKISSIRRTYARQMGLVVPPIRIKDNMQLDPCVYIIKLRGQELARWTIKPDQLLAMDAGAVTQPIDGEKTQEPAFGLPAVWIPEVAKEAAELAGYAVIDVPTVLVTHLGEVIKRNAAEILSREDTQKLVDFVKQENKAVVEELIPNLVSIGTIQRVLQNLLAERIPIVDLPTILEAIADYAGSTKDPSILTEFVRQHLSRTICSEFSDDNGTLRAITLDPRFEQTVAQSATGAAGGSGLALEPGEAHAFIENLSNLMQTTASSAYDTVLLTSAAIRRHIRSLVAPVVPELPVVSYNEIAQGVRIEAKGCLSLQPAEAAS